MALGLLGGKYLFCCLDLTAKETELLGIYVGLHAQCKNDWDAEGVVNWQSLGICPRRNGVGSDLKVL